MRCKYDVEFVDELRKAGITGPETATLGRWVMLFAALLAAFLAAFLAAIRLVLELIQLERKDAADLKAVVLALRQQVRVLAQQIKRARWQPEDRLILSVLRKRLPRTAWARLLVQPETVLGWHRELVRRRWAAYRGRPRIGRPQLAAECRELIQRLARENRNRATPVHEIRP